jgi:glycyl-tRNA synthetase
MAESLIDKVASLAKRRGFVFPGGEVHGGLAGTWDYGPLGVRLKNNVKAAWLRAVTQLRDDVEPLDAAILTYQDAPEPEAFEVRPAGAGGAPAVHLRPELAEGIMANFENVRQATRRRIPFGIAQIGRVFRNEPSPGSFIFRAREFEQLELLYFIRPGTGADAFEYWRRQRLEWYASELCIAREHLRFREHGPDELPRYARRAVDVEYEFPFGWKEVEGIHDRGSSDLAYFDEVANERYLPWVVETSAGVDRVALATLLDAYEEEPDKDGIRVVLRFSKNLAPIQVAVLPLSRKDNLAPLASRLEHELRTCFVTDYDETASIGKRYRRQDEIGTPLCVTVDFQTLEDRMVTIRQRDSMQQQRVSMDRLREALQATLDNLT